MKRLTKIIVLLVAVASFCTTAYAQQIGGFYFYPPIPQAEAAEPAEEVYLKGRAILDVSNVPSVVGCMEMRIERDGRLFSRVFSSEKEGDFIILLMIDKKLVLVDDEGEHAYRITFHGLADCDIDISEDFPIGRVSSAWRYDWNAQRQKLGAPGYDIGDGIIIHSGYPEWFLVSDPPYELFIEVYGVIAPKRGAWDRIKGLIGKK